MPFKVWCHLNLESQYVSSYWKDFASYLRIRDHPDETLNFLANLLLSSTQLANFFRPHI